MASSDRSRPKAAWLLLLAIPIVFGAVLAGAWWHRRPPPTPVDEPRTVPKITGQAVKPPPASQGYVGSQACTSCHSAIAESYAHHTMYRSAGVTPGDDDVEDFSEPAEFAIKDRRIYRVVKEADGIYHHELMRDENGEVIYDEAAKISYFIGSGARGKSYVIDRGGILFQSPISWYTAEKKFDISPGYDRKNTRFGRRIKEQCVLCHAGRAKLDAEKENVFPEPVLLEAAIGCERCHGPGQKHIEYHESAASRKSGDPIVNPASLEPDRREAVCNQCHLIGKYRFTRYGRTFDDFRPGDRLDDVWATLVAGTGVREDQKTKSVSHVQQMWNSTCFKMSNRRLGCTSCHDPHAPHPADDAATYFRKRCLECHAERGCTAPDEEQAAAPANNSCIYCHMPRLTTHDVAHASQTDHRIVRRQEPADISELGREPRTVVLFDEEHTSMPAWEVERAKALANSTIMQDHGFASTGKAEELRQVLTMLAEIAPDDVEVLDALATTAELRFDHDFARQTWEEALKIKPDSETILDSLTAVCKQMGDLKAALDYCDRLIAINPWRSRDFMRRALMLGELGRWQEAAAAGETAVKLDPTDKQARRWLIDAYQKLGDPQAGQHHTDFLKKLSPLGSLPPSSP